jgi:hypothetical protein
MPQLVCGRLVNTVDAIKSDLESIDRPGLFADNNY